MFLIFTCKTYKLRNLFHYLKTFQAFQSCFQIFIERKFVFQFKLFFILLELCENFFIQSKTLEKIKLMQTAWAWFNSYICIYIYVYRVVNFV